MTRSSRRAQRPLRRRGERGRRLVTSDRKSPLIAKGAKGGTPTSSMVGGITKSTARNGCATGDPRGPGEPGPYNVERSDGRMWGLWLLHRLLRRLSLGLAGGGG